MSDHNSSSGNESFSEDSGIDELGKRKHVGDSTKNRKKRKKELRKPPTTEELNRLRETENLYSSNLIRLQIEELLSEINIKQKYHDQIDLWWNNFSSVIKNLDSENELLLSEIQNHTGKKLKKRLKFINDLHMERTNLKYDKDLVLKFPSPESRSLLGEYGLKCLTKNDMQIYINLTMPSECFLSKDYLHNRYFIKRHYYTLYVLHSIKGKVNSQKMELLFFDNCLYLPFIQIVPEFSEKLKINIFVSASEKCFNTNRFLPNKNNIKYPIDDNFSNIDVKNFGELGTPMYNSIIVRDLTLCCNYEHMENLLNVKNIQDGIKLLIVWLQQRELNKGFGNFTNELVFYTIAYLLKKKKVNSLMSSYQVVRIFWSFMASSNWNDEAISLCDDVKDDTMNLYKKSYEVVFLDFSGCFNVASFLHLGVYLKLKQEAQLSLKILDGNKFNSFASLFLVKVPFSLQYDSLIKIKVSSQFKNIYQQISPERKWKYYGFYNILVLNEISDILRQGFTKRVSCIVPYIYDKTNENVNVDRPDIIIGINLNPEYAFNVIERGPAENNPEAVTRFQQFWKGLTSFRRFQDSTAAEVVYFPCKTLQDKRNIFTKILQFLFTKKYPLDVRVVSNQLEKVLKLEKSIIHFPTGTNEEACLKIKHIYNELSQKLRDLELPLIISNIQGISDVFSYTEVFPPIPTTFKEDQKLGQLNGNTFTLKLNLDTCPMFVSPIECVMQMGMSSGWPDDVSVLQCMKCEFYIRLSELLESTHDIVSSVTLDHLDVSYQGLVFRFRLFVQKELVLLKKTVDTENITSYKDNEESIKLERDLDILPKITSALSGIHQQYPSFGPCCALIKRWLRSQMIDDYHISDTVINLWNASLYLNDPPYHIANLPQVAFLRFLKHLSGFDWKLNPVIINFNDDIEGTTLSDMETQFQQNRNSFPNLYVITPYDQGKSVFTKTQPSKHVLKRICILARETYNFLSDTILKWDSFAFKDIFVPNLQGYDVLIYLKPSLNPLFRQSTSVSSDLDKNYIERYDATVQQIIPVVNFNPVDKYINELREIYGEYAVFFHDKYGGNIIGMLWNLKSLEPCEFKVSHVNGKKLCNSKLVINKDVILEDIYNRGCDLIQNIEKM